MTAEDARTQFRGFLTKRRVTLARLRRVNEAPSRWDEHDDAAAMPAEPRPVTPPPPSLARPRTP